METSAEADWIKKAQEGDQASFGRLIGAYQKKVFGFILGLLKDPQAADELTQTVFVKAWSALPRFRAESSFQTWLFQIALNSVRSWTRWGKVRWLRQLSLNQPRNASEDDLGSLEDHRPDHRLDADPSRSLESAELKKRMAQEIEKLPPREKMVFQLRHHQELPLKEIGDIMGIAEGSVKAHLFHALEKLRAALKEADHGL